MSYLRICHFITCMLLLGSLILGLTRKDLKYVNIWNWITRICYGVMAMAGILMWSSAAQIASLHSLAKCTLSVISIAIIEHVYRWKKNGRITKKSIILVSVLLLLTIICGCTLKYRVQHGVI